MRILVTGSAGFVGSHLCRVLSAAGHSVVGLDSMIGGNPDNVIPSEQEFVFGNILHLYRLQTATKGCHLIYHCAALAYEGLSVFSPKMVTENIVLGSINVMLAAIHNKVDRIVNLSSMARYGINPTPYRETMTPHPVDPYGVAKVAAERQMDILGRVHGVHVVHAIPHNVIGPRQRYDDPYRNVVAITINRILQGLPPLIFGKGEQVRCFSDIEDVLPSIVRLGFCTVPHGDCFNVGPDAGEITILTLMNLLSNIMGSAQRPVFVNPRPQEITHAVCSADKARKWFQFSQSVSLTRSLMTMVADITLRGPRPFNFSLPVELSESPLLPRTWREGIEAQQ